MPTREEFRESIRETGMTIAETAEFLGLSPSSIDKRLSGAVPVRSGEITALRAKKKEKGNE